MENCVFCKIIDRKLPSFIIDEDDDLIVDDSLTGGGTIKTDTATAGFSGDSIGFKTVSIIDIEDFDSFARQDIHGFKKDTIDRDAAFVMKFSLGHRGVSDFGFAEVD